MAGFGTKYCLVWYGTYRILLYGMAHTVFYCMVWHIPYLLYGTAHTVSVLGGEEGSTAKYGLYIFCRMFRVES